MNKLATAMILGGFGVVFMKTCVYVVDPGEKALIMDNIRGLDQKNIYGQGYNWFIPFLQTPIIYDVRLKTHDIPVSTGTKDMQNVAISLRVLQQPIVQNLPTIHQLLGRDYEKKVFNSIGQEVIRTIVAQYDADQLLKSRQIISKEIKNSLFQKARQFNINVEDVSFMVLTFSRQYSQAVQKRAVQQQLAEMQKFIVQRDQELKLAQIIRAEAQAQAAKLINNAVSKYGSTQIQIKKLEAAKSVAQLLSKNPNISFIPSNNTGNLLNLKV